MIIKTSIYNSKTRKLQTQSEHLEDILQRIDDIARHIEIKSFFWCDIKTTLECYMCHLLSGNEIFIDTAKSLYYSILNDFTPAEKEAIKQAAKQYSSKFSALKP